jgi:hypothetical protein
MIRKPAQALLSGLRAITRRVLPLVMAAAMLSPLVVFEPQAAYAQKKKTGNAGVPVDEEKKGQSYVLPYMLVVLALGLGTMSVGRPSRRKESPTDI